MKKRILSLLLATLMMALIIPISTSAEGTIESETELNDAITAITTVSGAGTIKLTGNITLTSAITIPGGTITLDLNGKTLDRGLSSSSAIENGYAIKVRGSTTSLTITDSVGGGKITGGNNTGNGGNIFVDESTLTIDSGTISGGVGGAGGAISAEGDATVNITGSAVISGNKSSSIGGAIEIFESTLNISGNATISNNEASTYGGAISVVDGTLNISGSPTISNNTARSNGGAIYVNAQGAAASATINGASITNNKVSNNGFGGGIYVGNSNVVLTLKGNAKITGNTVNSSANNVYLPAGALIAVQEPGSNMSVGISMASYGSFTNIGITLEESWKDYFTSDDPHHAVDTFNIDSLRFRLVDAYAVTFDTDGGSAIDAQGVISGKTVNKPTDPTKEGYTFFRWLDKDGKPFDFSTPITEDITLKASWLMDTYSVKFYRCVGDETPFCFYNVSYNNTIGNAPSPTREGYIFKGWYYNGKPFDFNTKVTCDMDVYAEWEAIAHDYKITEGAHALWLPKYAKGFLSFRSNADYSKFVSVEVDNKILDASKFIASAGSTIVKLKPEYLSTLAIGKHTLRIVSTDGYAETDFYIEDETIAPTDGGLLSEATMSSGFVGFAIVGLSAIFFELKKKKVK